MKALSDEKILDSWHKNVAPWTTAVRERQIPSRQLVTDRAVVAAVRAAAGNAAGNRVLDIGCGEGWLVRELTAAGFAAAGLDAVADLIAAARESGAERYLVRSYEALARDGLDEVFDLVVCNFSLLGKESVAALFAAVPGMLARDGHLVVQTLHPLMSCGEDKYEDGWREGSWQGFSDEFTDPAPWYFRTLQSWVALLRNSGLALTDIVEPLHPQTAKPASIIFTAKVQQ